MMTDTITSSETKTVTLYRKSKGEVIGTPALVDSGDLEKEDIVAAINNSGASVYVNDTGFRDRVYINIDYDDQFDGRESFGIDADLPTHRRLSRSLGNADLVIVGSPGGQFTLASLNVDNEVKAEIERFADDTYKVLKIIDDDDAETST